MVTEEVSWVFVEEGSMPALIETTFTAQRSLYSLYTHLFLHGLDYLLLTHITGSGYMNSSVYHVVHNQFIDQLSDSNEW